MKKKLWVSVAVVVFLMAAVAIAGVHRLLSARTEAPEQASSAPQPQSQPSAPPDTGYLPPIGAGMAPLQEKMVRCATHPQEIRPASGMVKVLLRGKTYYLCCNDCAARFRADPDPYIRELERAEKSSTP